MRKRFFPLTGFFLAMAFAGLSVAETSYSAQSYSAQTSSGTESDGTNPNNADLSAEDVAWLTQVYGVSQGEMTSLPSVYSTSTENSTYLPKAGQTESGAVQAQQSADAAGISPASPQTGGTAGISPVPQQTDGTAGGTALPPQTNGTAAGAGSVSGQTEGLNTVPDQDAGSVMVPVMGAFLDGTVLSVGAEITIGLADRSTIEVSPEICSVVSGGAIGYGFACRVFYERVKQDTNTYVDRFTQVLVYPQLINAGAKATPAPAKKSSGSGSAGSRSTNDAVSDYSVDVYDNSAQTAEDDGFDGEAWNETDEYSETAWDSEVYPEADSEAYLEGND